LNVLKKWLDLKNRKIENNIRRVENSGRGVLPAHASSLAERFSFVKVFFLNVLKKWLDLKNWKIKNNIRRVENFGRGVLPTHASSLAGKISFVKTLLMPP
jgi:hypothetical protein